MSTEAKPSFTPGPWRPCHAGECQCGMIWSESQDVHIVTAYGEREQGAKQFVIAAAHHETGDAADLVYAVVPEAERNANAKLCAAAPDLLAACEAAIAATGGSQHWNGWTRHFLILTENALRKAGVDPTAIKAKETVGPEQEASQ